MRSRLTSESMPRAHQKTSSHVRFTTASLPDNRLTARNYSMDALVVFSETVRARFRCLHPLAPYFAECSLLPENCGPFVTTKSMIEAGKDCDTLLEGCCGIAGTILGISSPPSVQVSEQTWHAVSRLNPSQNETIRLALNNPLLCLGGRLERGKPKQSLRLYRRCRRRMRKLAC